MAVELLGDTVSETWKEDVRCRELHPGNMLVMVTSTNGLEVATCSPIQRLVSPCVSSGDESGESRLR